MINKVGCSPGRLSALRPTRTVRRMDVGIDTYRSRIDLIALDNFRWFNGGSGPDGHVIGGEPAFAGRHFLGGTKFLWGHGEATDCMTKPSPKNLAQLKVLTKLIAPVQAPLTSRQQVTGAVGRVYGAIDARALGERLAAALIAGEFTLPAGGRVAVWLSVDSTVPLSADYWAGWANQVNTFPMAYTMRQLFLPFRAAVQCRFQNNGGQQRPDPQVVTALTTARTSWPGDDTTSHACWADAPTEVTPDWSVFAGGPTPLIWRTSHGFHPSGAPTNDTFDVDVTNPGGSVVNALDLMLQVQQWQPGLPSNDNLGIIHQDHVTKPLLNAVTAATIPSMTSLEIQGAPAAHRYTIPEGRVAYIGRYFQPHVVPPGTHLPPGTLVPTSDEVKWISAAGMDTFIISEDRMALGQNQNDGYFDPAHKHGEADGREAFTYCAETLNQPSHTPVFFTVDNFDPADPADPGYNANAAVWVTGYIHEIALARDAYEAQHPDFHYLIGFYTNGAVLRWCYEKGDLDMFWQTPSASRKESSFPERPWYHANRWQYCTDPELTAKGWTAWPGADPDADWGDGGRWNLRSPLRAELFWARLRQMQNLLHAFGNLTVPAPR